MTPQYDNRGLDVRRMGRISGSQCHVLFPERGDGKVGQMTYARELASELYWGWGDNITSWQTEHGHLAESSAREHYQQYFDSAIYKPDGKIIKKYFWISPDSINDVKRYGIDHKCPTSYTQWENYIFKGIDKQQYHQAQMYMWGMNYNVWYICPFLLETNKMANNGEQYPVPIDKRTIVVEVRREDGWGEKLLERAKFVIEKRDEFYKELEKQFGKK